LSGRAGVYWGRPHWPCARIPARKTETLYRDNRSTPNWYVPAMVLLVLAALAVRLYPLQCASCGHDGPISGMLGLSVLDGRWPIFFWGQNWMGSLDAYLAAPLYPLLGPTTFAVNLWPSVFNLATMAVLYPILRRHFHPVAVLAGLAYLAVPPALGLYHLSKPTNHYPLGILLSAVLIWLSLKLWEEKPWKRSTAFWWGLTGGLAIWTNFQSITVIWPCMLFLALFCLTRVRLSHLIWGLVGSALGAAPLIYYNATHAWQHMEQGGSFALQYWGPHFQALIYSALPLLFGSEPVAPLAEAVGPTAAWPAYLAVAAVMALGMALLLARAFTREGRWALLPVLVAVATMLILVGSVYGQQLARADLRGMVPVYLGLTFAVAALADFLWRRRPWAVAVLMAGLLTFHLASWTTYRGGALLCPWQGFVDPIEQADRRLIAKLRKQGIKTLYLPGGRTLQRMAYYSGESPQASDYFNERRQYAAVEVDASADPGYLEAPNGAFSFLGLQHEYWNNTVHHAFRAPEGAARPLERGDWRVSDLAGAPMGEALMDNDLATGWVVEPKQGLGRGVVVDLGRERMIGGLAMMSPTHEECPHGLWLDLAGEDRRFETVRRMQHAWSPLYWSAVHPFHRLRYPRVESYFPPRPVRYLRLRLMDNRHPRLKPMLVGELLVMGQGRAGDDGADWPETARRVARLALEQGAKRVYADAWLAARLNQLVGDEFWVLPANLRTDNYGSMHPPIGRPLELDASPGSLLAVPAEEADQAAAALKRAEVGHRRQRAGLAEVFTLQGRELPGRPVGMLEVSSEIDPVMASGLVRGYGGKARWGSLNPQRPGMGLTIKLAREAEVATVRILSPAYPKDFPRGLRVLVSDDGLVWGPAPARLAAPLVFAGRGVFAMGGPVCEYRLDRPVTTRFVRLELRSRVPVWWWSVQKIEVLGPAKPRG